MARNKPLSRLGAIAFAGGLAQLSMLPAAEAEMQIRLKNGKVVELPYKAEDIESIIFGAGAAQPTAPVPQLPKGGNFIAEPLPGGGVKPVAAGWNSVKEAIARAAPGDVITIPAGRYAIGRGQTPDLSAHGTAAAPITLRAEKLGDVVLEVSYLEGMRLRGSHWIIENLEFVGVCQNHSQCEHALHFQPGSHDFVIRNNRLIDFNAAIKGSASDREGRTGPATVTVEGNWFYNTTPRNTGNPVTPIDINGGHDWVVRSNYIADFAKAGGNKVSYGAFLKRASFDGLFEGNLVVCEQRHRGGVRIGLSLGGGGAGQEIEHSNGTIRSNIIMNCTVDVGLYINRGRDTKIYNNILYNTGGIDIRFPPSTADLRNNVVSARVRDRNGGSHTSAGDRVNVGADDFKAWFRKPEKGDFRPLPGAPVLDAGVAAPGLEHDFCGRPVAGHAPYQGAIASPGEDCPMLEKLWTE